MQNREIHDMNNNLKGSEYDVEVCASGGDLKPIRRGVITIDRALLGMTVYPARTSRQGRMYYPIRLHYLPSCEYVLKAVQVGKNSVSP